jgi:hypothetical protein
MPSSDLVPRCSLAFSAKRHDAGSRCQLREAEEVHHAEPIAEIGMFEVLSQGSESRQQDEDACIRDNEHEHVEERERKGRQEGPVDSPQRR